MRRTGACAAAAVALAVLGACGKGSREVGEFSNDISGNDIRIDVLRDEEVAGVVCHIARFDRSMLDRASKGNWFENPSNSSIACQRTGPIDLAKADRDGDGEEIFSERASLFLKRVAIRRIVDVENKTLIYVSYSREVVEGSAKMSLSTIPLTDEELAGLK
jgi:CreA protein